MCKRNTTTVILAAGAAALAYLLARAESRADCLAAECADLWQEGQDERQACELLRDDLVDARMRLRNTEGEWVRVTGELGRARGEVSRAHDVNRKLLDGFAADAVRRAERQQASGYWAWTSPRIQPAGPFAELDAARSEAEAMARRYPGRDVYLLSAVATVRVPESEQVPEWFGERRECLGTPEKA